MQLPEVVTRLRGAGCVFAEDEAQLLVAAASSPPELASLVERRAAGLPLEHLLGWAAFCGLRIAVDPGVFVPRRRTEFLVQQALVLPGRGEPRVVVDLCCGSGAVGLALAAALGPVEVHATDVDPAAVRCARGNLAAVGGAVYEGDLDAPLPQRLRGRVDILVANAPYVPTKAIAVLPPEARLHEPRAALDGGTDGLAIVRRVIAAAPRWLAPGGSVLVETSERQAVPAREAISRAGLLAHHARSEEHSATVVIGTRAIGGVPAVAAGAPPLE